MCCIKFEDSSCLEETNKQINKISLIKKTEHYDEVIHVENLPMIKITINTIILPLTRRQIVQIPKKNIFPMTWQILKIKNQTSFKIERNKKLKILYCFRNSFTPIILAPF